MQNKLFRQESIDRISSPEELHDYMCVTSPRLWMILAAIAVLLVGFLVYASTATMENTLTLKVRSLESYIYTEVPAAEVESVRVGMAVRVDGREATVVEKSQSIRMRLRLDLDSETQLQDGYYQVVFEDKENAPQSSVDGAMYVTVSSGAILTTAYYDHDALEDLKKERRVRITGSAAGKESSARLGTISSAESIDTASIWVQLNDPEATVPDGVHDAEVILESTTPISFLLN